MARVTNDSMIVERLPLLDGVLGIEIPENENTRHLAALESLVAGYFVRKGPAAGTYEFRHDQIRDVVYGSIPGQRPRASDADDTTSRRCWYETDLIA
jgi:hypothetical protein